MHVSNAYIYMFCDIHFRHLDIWTWDMGSRTIRKWLAALSHLFKGGGDIIWDRSRDVY